MCAVTDFVENPDTEKGDSCKSAGWINMVQNQEIITAFFDSSLGRVAIARTTNGLAAIRFLGSDQKLQAELDRLFKKADLIRADGVLKDEVDRVQDLIETPGTKLGIPLDVITGTEFQQNVWKTVRRLRLGKTITYSQLAEKIGQPTAVRAVANSCSANPLMIAIPCHRVVRANGDLSGCKKWGDMKEMLLSREREAAEAKRRRKK